jgi:hypothetical protein
MAKAGRSVRKKATKKKRKHMVAVPSTPQARNAPYVPDSSTAVGSAVGIGAAEADEADFVLDATGTADAYPVGIGDFVLDATGTVGPDAYNQMLARLTELEATVAQLLPLLPSIPGIGHNNPPPIDHAELEEIKRDIALLKAQPQPAPAEANNIASKFVRVAGRVLTWIGNHLNTFISEFMKASGKAAGATAGTALVLSPIWLTFGHQLTDSAAAIMQWVMTQLGQ